MRYISEVQQKTGKPYFYVRVPWRDRTKNWRSKTFSYECEEGREEALAAARAFRDKHLISEFGTTNFPDRHTGHKKMPGKTASRALSGYPGRSIPRPDLLIGWLHGVRGLPAAGKPQTRLSRSTSTANKKHSDSHARCAKKEYEGYDLSETFPGYI
jgi:hypothetical protein